MVNLTFFTQKIFFDKPSWSNKTLWTMPCVLLCVACQPNATDQSSKPPAIQPTNPVNQPKLNNLPPLNHIQAQTADLAGQEIAEKLALSYARASAYTSNECPKLVEFQFSNQSITRQDERFPKLSCDYLIYLKQGEILTINVSNEVKTELISPANFDFANGSYVAPKYDKYTIRLSYNGTRFNPQNFKYDVILTKAKGEATY